MSTTYNTFQYNIESAFISVTQGLISTEINWSGIGIQVAHGQQSDRILLPQVVCYAEDFTEEVFKSGIYRCKIGLKARIDMDIQPLSQLEDISSLINDLWQLSDLEAELTNTGLVVVKLVIPGEINPIELGDRYAERTAAGEVIGYSIPQTYGSPASGTTSISGTNQSVVVTQIGMTSTGLVNVWQQTSTGGYTNYMVTYQNNSFTIQVPAAPDLGGGENYTFGWEMVKLS